MDLKTADRAMNARPTFGYETAKEGAWRLRLPLWRIYHWGRLGLIPSRRLNQRRVLYELRNPPPRQPAGWETAKEIAWRLRCCADSIRRWATLGLVPEYRINRRVIYYQCPVLIILPKGKQKLGPDRAGHIKRLLLQGLTCYRIAKLFGVTHVAIRNIRDGRSYKTVQERQAA